MGEKIRMNGRLILSPNIEGYFRPMIIKGAYLAKEEVEIDPPKVSTQRAKEKLTTSNDALVCCQRFRCVESRKVKSDCNRFDFFNGK